MSDLIITLSRVMRAEVDSLNSVAQNSANVNTPGYKSIRTTAAASNFAATLASSSPPAIATSVNTERGKISLTEQPLDFAIMGDAWFGVQREDGVKLTRNGNFKLNSDNVLTTQAGHPVLSAEGTIILFSDAVHVEPDGTLSTAEGDQFSLAIYDVDNADLVPAGDSLYSSTSAHLAENSYKVVQGALEDSNVDAAADMVRLMKVTRHIESMQRAINTYNELLSTGINEIGK